MAEKKYIIDNAELMAEWNWEKNTELRFDPNLLTVGSGKKVWWQCQEGHEWQATIDSRNKGAGCPCCSGRMVVKGYNDLESVNPMLAREWNYAKNTGLAPNDVLPNSNKKVWWKCLKGHEWQALISNRNKGTSCPYCAGQKVIKGYNDLGIVNPKLAQEWNYEKNGVLKPEDFTESSGKRVWWKCNKGHEWQARIADRTVGHGCPYCSNRYIIKGENDLQTANPTLASEWNYEKNENLKPENFTANSGKKVWWKCRKGHEWQATIVSRNRGNGCPICSSEQRTSFPEYAIVYYLSKYGLEVMHSYKEQGYELDIYIPAKRIAIEYDGYVWHKNKTKQDLEKNYKCAKDGIKLYRIREGLPPLNGSSIDYVVQRNQEDLPEILEEVLSEIVTTNVDVDIDRDSIAIENLREYNEKVSSLLYSSPEIADEWNCEKNGKLKLEHFTANSHKKVWWKCSQGHEWQSAIANRTRGNGCPYCSGQKVLMGYNDLQTVNPTLAKEWNYEKNGELTPSDITPNSSKIVWWKCQKGHEWQATIANRNKGNGCPYCSGRFTLKNENDLQTVNPALAKEWNYEKNDGLTPIDVMTGSNKKVWWKCGKGHEWQATVVDRKSGGGCPFCSGKKVLPGYNDLRTVNPTLTEQWDYEKNSNLKPENYSANSHEKVWWKCSKGHRWQATIASRNNGRRCPYCSNKSLLPGYNDLATTHPEIAKEWDYSKNGDITPSNVMAGSNNKKYWFVCENGHSYSSTLLNRKKGRGCPVCRKNKGKKAK